MSIQEANTPRVGVIGLGSIGRTHINAWLANGVTPVAFADAVSAAVEAIVQEHGGEGFDDGIKLIQSGTINIVSICTPPVFHKELAIAAAAAGVAVICEKPLARTLADAEAITEAVERAGTLFTVGFCHRFEPAIEKLKEMIDNDDLGEIMTFRNRFAGHNADVEKTWFASPEIAGGGVMADTNIHSIDLFRHLIGDPTDVHAFVNTRETSLGPKLEVQDTSVMTLRTRDGVLGVIEGSWRTPPGEWTVTIYGTRGTAIYDYTAGTLTFRSPDTSTETIEVEPESRFNREFAHLIECWHGNTAPRVTVRDGLAANRILDKAYASSS